MGRSSLQTDGLGDNIHPQEILLLHDHVRTQTPPSTPPSSPSPDNPSFSSTNTFPTDYADALLQYGRVCMNSMTKESPFQVAAAREGLDFRGGKVDE